MDILSLIVMALKFLFGELPALIEQYKLMSKDNTYKKESDRIDAAIKAYKDASTSKARLDQLKELGQ